MRTVHFNFKEEDDYDFFVELLLEVALNRVRLYKKLEADFESLRSAHPALEERKRLENKISELEKKLISSAKNKIDMQFSLEKAQNVLKDAGYIFYKYQKPKTLKQRRHRRTRKEMEEAGLAIRK